MKKTVLITLFCIAAIAMYAQKPAVTSLEIAGRALRGTDEFGNSKPLTNIGNGQFVYYGYFYHSNPEKPTGNQGFKFSVNRHIAASTEWNNNAYTALVPSNTDESIVAGNSYPAIYSDVQPDNKWRLSEGEGWFKITVHTSNLDNVIFDFDAVAGSFADLASLTTSIGTLSPNFNPNITDYTCYLPLGTAMVNPVVATYYNTSASGTEDVDVSSGSGVSTIVVTSLDSQTTKTYTINYTYTTNNSIDYTYLIVNNSFEYARQGYKLSDYTYLDGNTPKPNPDVTIDGWYNNAWRPKESTEKEFYGWSVTNWDFATNNSQGLNCSMNPRDGMYGLWLMGDKTFPELFEFYQIIEKDALSAGTYKVQCRLSLESGKRTSQRLFANQNVQYYGAESQYLSNQTASETATFAGWSGGVDNLQEMAVYVTIDENDSLKIGIRTGNKQGDGTVSGNANPLWGGFKLDYFRLIKLDPADAADATLASLSVNDGELAPGFAPATETYSVAFPVGTTVVTPTAIPTQADAKVTGTEAVDVSSGAGVSTIVVTALDGTTTKTYTVNYTINEPTGIATVSHPKAAALVSEGKLTVKGAGSYAVYALNGVRVADVKANASNVSIALPKGVYVVRTNNTQTLKVIVR